jgi:hypothetical protein
MHLSSLINPFNGKMREFQQLLVDDFRWIIDSKLQLTDRFGILVKNEGKFSRKQGDTRNPDFYCIL